MTRINVFRKTAAPRDSVAWGKDSNTTNIATAVLGNANALIFAAVLIVCSVAVGCSSDKPKPVSSNIQIPVTQPQAQPQAMPAPVVQAENKPAPKKPVVHKKPATVNYTDKTYGVTFEYPRRFAIETGDAAADLLLSNPIPMNFVQPGGVALAAVELPETNYTNTDFSSAFFNVSVHKTLTADQCNEFSVPQPKSSVKPEPAPATPSTTEVAKQDPAPMPNSKSTSEACHPEGGTSCGPKEPTSVAAAMGVGSSASTASSPAEPAQNSKLMLGDMELRATEAVSGEGTRQSDSKYFHVYQNGSCYEFALNVTTVASEQGVTKHVDRDKVFNRLEQILSTVKINPVTPEVTAEAPAPAAPETPAQ